MAHSELEAALARARLRRGILFYDRLSGPAARIFRRGAAAAMNFGTDLIFFFFLAFLVFGPKKLPEIARLVGKTMGELRRASNEFRFSLEEEIRNADLAEEAKKAQATLTAHPAALPESADAGPEEGEEKDWRPESDPAWKEVEGLSEHGDADADAEPEYRGGRGWHEPELERAAAAGAAEDRDMEKADEANAMANPLGSHAEPEPEPSSAAAERQGGVPGTVPTAERPWRAPERRSID